MQWPKDSMWPPKKRGDLPLLVCSILEHVGGSTAHSHTPRLRGQCNHSASGALLRSRSRLLCNSVPG